MGKAHHPGHPWVPRWTEEGSDNGGSAFIDDVSQVKNKGPYFSQRKHRLTVSGVWELPWYRNEKSVLGYVLGGWSIAPMYVGFSKTTALPGPPMCAATRWTACWAPFVTRI